MNIIPLFCEIDDFLQVYEKQIAQRQLPIPDQPKKRGCPRKLHTSEVMTLLVAFHQSRYQTFKDYYTKQVCENLRWAFPHLVSYNLFVELMFEAFVPLCAYLQHDLENAVAYLLSIRHRSVFVITDAFTIIAFLMGWLSVAKPRSDGFMASNFISSSMNAVNSYPFGLRQQIQMIVDRYVR